MKEEWLDNYWHKIVNDITVNDSLYKVAYKIIVADKAIYDIWFVNDEKVDDKIIIDIRIHWYKIASDEIFNHYTVDSNIFNTQYSQY